MSVCTSLAEMVRSGISINEGLGGFPVLETDRLRLREVRPREDAAQWHSSLPDPGRANETIEQIAEGFEGVRSRFYDRKYVIYWAITLKDDDRMIGNVRFWEWAGHPERPLQFGTIQYDLADGHSDATIAAEALRVVGEFGLTRLGLARVQCTIYPDDRARSEALLAAGFRQEGTLRSWWFDADSQQWKDEVMFSFVEADMAE